MGWWVDICYYDTLVGSQSKYQAGTLTLCCAATATGIKVSRLCLFDVRPERL